MIKSGSYKIFSSYQPSIFVSSSKVRTIYTLLSIYKADLKDHLSPKQTQHRGIQNPEIYFQDAKKFTVQLYTW